MPAFGAEVRHIDDGRRIVRQEPDRLARRQGGEPLAQLQDGQGAEQPEGIEQKVNLPLFDDQGRDEVKNVPRAWLKVYQDVFDADWNQGTDWYA